MKKELKAELVSIAHKILKMGNDPDYATMQAQTKKLYDTLAVLAFAERHFDGIQPSIGKQEIIEALQEKPAAEVQEIIAESHIEEKVEVEAPASPVDEQPMEQELEPEPEYEEPTMRIETDAERVARIARENQERFEANKRRKEEEERQRQLRHEQKKNDEFLFEPVTEKIKDIVSQMPDQQEEFEKTYEEVISPRAHMKNDMGEIGEFGKMADFEEKETITETKPKSLNDKLNKGLTFGLNDRLAYIKHLFDGSTSDYNRVLSQLNTASSKDEAVKFINTMVKPDHNNWEGKEFYENRFMDAVEKRFES